MGQPMGPRSTIQEILAHPRYREFATDCTERGRQVVPDSFPWKLMGQSDEEILASPLQWATGERMPESAKRNMILVVRAQEKLVTDWWTWWKGWEWISKARRPAPEHIDDQYAQAEAARANRQPQPEPGMLF